MAEHQSRRSVLNFNQTQMPPIRIQINHTLIPRPEPVKEFDRQRAGRFDMPHFERIKHLERELREVRTKFVEKDIELNQVKLVATEHLNSSIIDIREQAKITIQKLETELSEANDRLKEMVNVGDNSQLAQRRIKLKQTASATQKEEVSSPHQPAPALSSHHSQPVPIIFENLSIPPGPVTRGDAPLQNNRPVRISIRVEELTHTRSFSI